MSSRSIQSVGRSARHSPSQYFDRVSDIPFRTTQAGGICWLKIPIVLQTVNPPQKIFWVLEKILKPLWVGVYPTDGKNSPDSCFTSRQPQCEKSFGLRSQKSGGDVCCLTSPPRRGKQARVAIAPILGFSSPSPKINRDNPGLSVSEVFHLNVEKPGSTVVGRLHLSRDCRHKTWWLRV